MVDHFEILVSRQGDTTTLVLRGELDLSSADAVHHTVGDLLDDPTQKVIVDFTGLTFLDAAGVSPLVRLANAVEQAGSRVFAQSAISLPALLISMTPIEFLDDSLTDKGTPRHKKGTWNNGDVIAAGPVPAH